MDATGLNEEDAEACARLCGAVAFVADAARAHLAAARAATGDVPSGARRALLPAVPASLYLDWLGEAGHDVFDEGLLRRTGIGMPEPSATARLRVQAGLAWAAMRGRF